MSTASTPWQWFRVPMALYDRLAEIGRAASVYIVLARMADTDGRSYPAHKEISARTGIPERTVRHHLAALKAAGLVTWKRRRRDSDVYLLPDLAALKNGNGLPDKEFENGNPLPDKNAKNGKKRRQERQKRDVKNGNPLPTKKNHEGEPLKERDIAVPVDLSELMHGWNKLGDGIVKAGNHVRVDRPSKAVLSAWNRRKSDSDLAEATADIPALLAAVGRATFCHGQGWLTLPWLFGKNKNGELNAPRLLAGIFEENQNGKANGSRKEVSGSGRIHGRDWDAELAARTSVSSG